MRDKKHPCFTPHETGAKIGRHAHIKVTKDMITQPKTLDNMQSLDRLVDWGGAFCLVKRGGKAPIGRGWQRGGAPIATVSNHIGGGGSVGLLGGSLSGGLVFWDLDRDYGAWAARFPLLATSATVIRRNEPDRGKVILRVRDRLPASTSSREAGCDLLADGKQGVFVGLHPSGARYELTAGELVTVGFDDLAAAWLDWTGSELWPVGVDRASVASGPGKVATAATSADRGAARQPVGAGGSLVEQVRAAWPVALDVFKHWGRVGEIQSEPGGDLRLLNNGGLIVGDPAGPSPWRWYCFSDDNGGDTFDAWAYCMTGQRLNRADKKLFRAVLVDMATAAGIEIKPDPDPVYIPDPSSGELVALADFLALGRDLAGVYDWHYETVSGGRRSDPSALKTFVAALAIMGKAGGLESPLSTRHIATAAGMGNKTAGDALERLVGAYGLLERVKGGTAFLASVYRLSGDFVASVWSHRDTLQFNTQGTTVLLGAYERRVKPLCVELQTSSVDTQTVSDYGDHDAFLRTSTPKTGEAAGVKSFKAAGGGVIMVDVRDGETGSGGRSGDKELGPSALLVVAALVAADGQNVGELASSTGLCASTVSRILGSLAENGLIELDRGRSLVASLRDDWRLILDRVTRGLRTAGLSHGRKLKVISSRLARFGWLLARMHKDHNLHDLVASVFDRAVQWRRALEQAVAA